MGHKTLFAALVVSVGPALAAPRPRVGAKDIRSQIQAALDRAQELKMMEPGKLYELPAGGKAFRGTNDDFLRRRSAQEILDSGLSTGCGDFTLSFYELMRRSGARVLYLDAVELSAGSLLNRFDGHTGVAVQEPESGRWILVDPTSHEIVSENWDVQSKLYEGRYWIWYLGTAEHYPARDPDSLKALYDKALKSVPPKVWNERLIRLDFRLDASMTQEGVLVNPHAREFVDAYSGLYERFGLSPRRRMSVILADSGIDDAQGDCVPYKRGLFCSNGRKSAMSQGWFSWIEERAARAADRPKLNPR